MSELFRGMDISLEMERKSRKEKKMEWNRKGKERGEKKKNISGIHIKHFPWKTHIRC